ncbi:leucyl/phenylalanyl-tRNA--protein transferase [Pseudoxanthomonas daejeonensis]|uniref:Leucyl/phenylalanyl-tRNA--protein transferase n=1 Tax=Pseudoxanthomonas daejeonensis TaxID=266062 RepID=A0ABQ6Z6Y8_9GAMM|nr:leucyl/phenylalanyl-tRNA--protein transferase [Pseudoxanthomonas daejeonensis]KAF1694018.1 leucyl/phenylalanyl-tRNA--protein transferase [Pseudoxanthomonas daejeonensis]
MAARPYLLPDDPGAPFPPASQALREPDGLLAVGGDLSPGRLLAAYRGGIFPWYSRDQPILWWSPDPRMVFRTDAVHLSSRLRRELRRSRWCIRADTAFDAVLAACAETPRPGQRGTWITPEMRLAYARLHRLGHAHSVEVLDGDGQLVGGIYGVAIGRMFFGESMFSAQPGGSKVALAALARQLDGWGWPLLDAQVENPHLYTLGGETWPRARFLESVEKLVGQRGRDGSWTAAFGTLQASTLTVATAC